MKTTECWEHPRASQRLLIGVLVVVGVSVAGWPAIEQGFSEFQVWMVERLAEWDTWRPSEKDCMLVTERPAPPRRAVADPATTEQPRRAGTGPWSDRVGLDADQSVAAREWWVSTAGEASLDLRLARELYELTAGRVAEPTKPAPSTRVSSVLVAAVADADLFEENPDGYEPVEEDSASETSHRSEPMSHWQVGTGNAEEDSAFEMTSWPEPTGRRHVATGHVEQRPLSPPPVKSTVGPSHDELSRALTLTREAARAWMDVLAGTNSVRVTAR